MKTGAKRRLVTLFDRIRADLNDATSQLEDDNVDGAMETLTTISTRIHDTTAELRS